MGKKTIWAVVVTVVWVGVGLALICFKLDDFKSLKLNEIGDFLAGFFSPVAFLWLVFGYFQQGEELQLNTKALELQVNELQLSVLQQRELVAVTQADMLLSKQAYEREKDKDIRQAQPALNLALQSTSGYGSVYEVKVSITNAGHSVSRVALKCAECTVAPDKLAVLGAEAAQNIIFNFTEMPSQGFNVEIEYVDGLGVKRHQVVKAERHPHRMFDFFPPEDFFPEGVNF